MMTDKDYWDCEQFYDEVGRELRRKKLSFDTNALFDLIIPRWPTEKTASAVADELIATYPERFASLPSPAMFYVATLARFVLVEAENEEQARERGAAALEELYAELRRQFDAEMPANILTVRPATSDEVEFSWWNEETLAREEMERRG
jgi:hypothetical protein